MTKNYVIIGIVTFLLLSFFNGYSQNSNLFGKAENSAREGFSIFDNTMVDMPWTEIEKSINKGAIVLLPVAVIEEHGPHMNCGPDIYQICLITKMVRESLINKGVETLIAPPVYWGIADIGKEFPGNFTVREQTFRYLLNDIFVSLNSWGVENVVVFDGHGEPKHNEIIKEAIFKANSEIGIQAYFCVNQNQVSQYRNTKFENLIIPVNYKPELEIHARFDNHHAGCFETGTMAAFFPEMVDTVMARALEPTNFKESGKYSNPKEMTEDWYKNAKTMTPLGYFGDPASFDVNKSIINFYNNAESEADAIKTFFDN